MHTPRKTALARKMRKDLTLPEHLIWHRLKGRDNSGITFRRQHALGPYILDFYCYAARMVIEIDGAHHGFAEAHARDAHRDDWLASQGLLVYRLTAADVLCDADAAADGIKLLAIERAARFKAPPHPFADAKGSPLFVEYVRRWFGIRDLTIADPVHWKGRYPLSL